MTESAAPPSATDPPVPVAPPPSEVVPTETAGGLPTAPPAATGTRGGLLWVLIVATVVLDQAVKAAVVAWIPLYGAIPVISGVFDLVHVRNAGVAFGLMNSLDHPQRGMFTSALALVALASIVFYARFVQAHERLARMGLSLILGGAVGNLIDRLRQGYVVDFVDLYVRGWHFWAFNVADAAITVGAVLVCVDILFVHRHAPDSV